MLCIHCGVENPEDRRSCLGCSRQLDAAPGTAFDTRAWLGDDDGGAKTSRLALASLGFGLLSVFPPAGLAAIVLGHASLVGIRHSNGELRGQNVARLALICGYIGLALFAALLLVASFYLEVPLKALFFSPQPVVSSASSLGPAQREPGSSLDEMRAMNTLLQVHVAETVHYHTNPALGYSCDLKVLHGSGLASDALLTAAQEGYSVVIDPCTRSATGKVTTYQALAVPATTKNGSAFCTDHTGIIRVAQDNALASCAQTGAPVK